MGGGLAGALAAYRCLHANPGLRLRLLEKDSRLGGNHTWSFHGTDLSESQRRWVAPLVQMQWPGYSVQFPRFQRHFKSEYFSLAAERLHEVVAPFLGERVLYGANVRALSDRWVEIEGQGRLTADCVVDARGWAPSEVACGYQKFLGQDLRLEQPHGLTEPVLMDSTVEQLEGFRFIYLLPWDSHRLLVEDTRYSDTAHVDAPVLRSAIQQYVKGRGWRIAEVEREEVGSLPIPFALNAESSPVAAIGARAGQFHPTTGYSFPDAVATADALATQAAAGAFWPASRWQAHNRRVARSRWFYRFLNRMLFGALAPERRYALLERFYRLPQGLIERFYAARLRGWECACLALWGRPPSGFRPALHLFFEKRTSHV